MRQPAPTSRPVALTIAGSDSGGGAGVQADLKTMEAVGAFGTSVVTAVTAQNTRGVDSSFVLPVEEIAAQLESVTTDVDVRAAKTGMLATSEVVELVAERAPELGCPLVVDPVMVATSGDRLLSEDAEVAYEALVAEATVVTPNADEAAVLTGIEVTDGESAREAGEAIVAMGADAALVKGGHVGDGRGDGTATDVVTDWLVTASGVETFTHGRVDTDATHGSGCTLSAAIAAELASGVELETAVGRSTDLLAQAVRHHHDVGDGPGSVHHLVALRDRAARQETSEAVGDLASRLTTAADTDLVPARGMAVAGATPYAEHVEDVAALDGLLTRTEGWLVAPQSVSFGADEALATRLLAAREDDPTLRFAVTVRPAAVDVEDEYPVIVDHDADEAVVLAATPGELVERVTRLAG